MMRVKDDSEGTVTTEDEADKSDYSPWRTTVTSLSLETLFRGEQQRHAKTAEANEYCLGPISGDCSAAAHSQHSDSHGTSGCRLCCLERKGGISRPRGRQRTGVIGCTTKCPISYPRPSVDACETLPSSPTTAASSTMDRLRPMAGAVTGASSKECVTVGMVVSPDTPMLELHRIFVKNEEARVAIENLTPHEMARVVTCGEMDAYGILGVKCRLKPAKDILGLALLPRIAEDYRVFTTGLLGEEIPSFAQMSPCRVCELRRMAERHQQLQRIMTSVEATQPVGVEAYETASECSMEPEERVSEYLASMSLAGSEIPLVTESDMAPRDGTLKRSKKRRKAKGQAETDNEDPQEKCTVMMMRMPQENTDTDTLDDDAIINSLIVHGRLGITDTDTHSLLEPQIIQARRENTDTDTHSQNAQFNVNSVRGENTDTDTHAPNAQFNTIFARHENTDTDTQGQYAPINENLVRGEITDTDTHAQNAPFNVNSARSETTDTDTHLQNAQDNVNSAQPGNTDTDTRGVKSQSVVSSTQDGKTEADTHTFAVMSAVDINKPEKQVLLPVPRDIVRFIVRGDQVECLNEISPQQMKKFQALLQAEVARIKR